MIVSTYILKTRFMKRYFYALIMATLSVVSTAFGQEALTVTDTLQQKVYMISALNLKPEALAKKDLLIRLNFDLPHYFRTLSPATGKMEKTSKMVVLNEMYVNTYLDYGLSDKLTLFTQLPLWDVNHSSPMGIVKGKGLSDIGIGADYGLIKKDSSKNALTAEGTVLLPSGKSNHLTPQDYPLGMGVVRFRAALTGMHRYDKSSLVGSVYYEFRPENSSKKDVGDEVGITCIKQNYFNTRFGNFGIEYGALSYLKSKNKQAGVSVNHSDDFAIDAYGGAWFEYQKNLFLRFGIPYTIYQNRSFLTKYNVLVQLDYRFKL
jgi:hypothetical protein